MPPLTREQLAARRATRRRPRLRRDPRALISAAIPLVAVAALAIALGVMGNGAASDSGPLASPVPSPELGSGARPPELVIARFENVDIHLPVDPERVTAAAFRPIDDLSGVPLVDSGSITIRQSDRRGRAGPETAGLDVGAPAGTTVYSPVDGVVATVSDYTISGRIEGYEMTITPSVAPTGLVLRIRHLGDREAAARPSVGTAVRAGITPLGVVHDFTGVASQELAQFTSDAGNHVAIELIRTPTALIL